MKKVCINSDLYNQLFLVGGDSLIAVYAMLRFHKNQQIKYYKENINIYQTLKKRTGLSVTTLRKYIKELGKVGLCRFDSKGNFCLMGTSKVNKLYQPKRTKAKIVIIEIGTFAETKLFSFKVRVLTMEKSQKRRIDRKDRLNKIMKRAKKGYSLTKYELHSLKNMTDLDKEYNLKESITAKTVLSNQGFSRLKFGQTKTKSSGHYWRNKLVSAGIIKTRRRFQFIKRCSHKEYLYMKYNIDISLVYKNGRMFKELVPEFTTTDFPIKEVKPIVKLNYLQFDFCHFLSKQ